MEIQKLIAIVLIITGTMGLAYGGFTYTKETHETDFGPIHMSVDETQHVNVPIWVGVGAIMIGGLMLVGGIKKS